MLVSKSLVSAQNSLLGTCSNWLSSTVLKVSKCVSQISLDQAATTLIAGAYLTGAVYAVLNPTPYFHPYQSEHDVALGAAIAMGTSMAICSVTSAIKYLRGENQDGARWLIATAAVGSPALFLAPKILQVRHIKAEIRQYDVDYPKTAGDCFPKSARALALDCDLLENVKPFIDENDVMHLPRSSAGRSGVRFAHSAPVVIKEDLRHDLVTKMEAAQKICQKNNYTHLSIAKVSYYKNHVVQSRLPIKLYNAQIQIGLYLENAGLFTDAIRQFTGFICQAGMFDLIGHNALDPVHDKWPRLDNISVYIEESDDGCRGKIALVDLDAYAPEVDSNCQILDIVRLFPHHIEEILQEAKKFNPNIEEMRTSMQQTQNDALSVYDLHYSKHAAYLRAKNVPFSEPAQLCELEETSEILKLTTQFIKSELEKKHTFRTTDINSFEELVSFRLLKITSDYPPYFQLINELKAQLRIPYHQAQEIVISTFKQLAENNYISHVINAPWQHTLLLFC